jgi:aryl-phospho-beta-D-glucosidase BglC (GH1 family)
MSDVLSLWKEVGWGWAMWNLRGRFGLLDSNRADVEYEDFHGHKLDRKMLNLLMANYSSELMLSGVAYLLGQQASKVASD